jgi:hypothetical protein
MRLHVLALVDLEQVSGSDGQREVADAEKRVAASRPNRAAITMAFPRQPVATHGNGFRLVEPL